MNKLLVALEFLALRLLPLLVVIKIKLRETGATTGEHLENAAPTSKC